MSFSLLTFLRNHKPKADDVGIYLTRPKLAKYKYITDKNFLQPRKMWIRYVPYKDMTNRNYDLHIKPGGFLLACGRIRGGAFIKSSPSICTHLMLKYQCEENRIFFIRTDQNYIFARNLRPKITVNLMGDDEEIERLVESFLQKVPRIHESTRRK